MILKDLCSQFGQVGSQKLHGAAPNRYWWLPLPKDIRDFCRACPVGSLKILIRMIAPFIQILGIEIDVIGSLLVTERGIMVVYFIKAAEPATMASQDADHQLVHRSLSRPIWSARLLIQQQESKFRKLGLLIPVQSFRD